MGSQLDRKAARSESESSVVWVVWPVVVVSVCPETTVLLTVVVVLPLLTFLVVVVPSKWNGVIWIFACSEVKVVVPSS
jgi:hypothetical protein